MISRYKHVSWHKTRAKWVAQLVGDRRKPAYKYFDSELEAAEAVRKWLKKPRTQTLREFVCAHDLMSSIPSVVTGPSE